MNKDIIYIDVEDDITSIISKIKNSKDKIVALVPPKRIGVLQSAVNLRLLSRIAEKNHKHLVLVTNNQALVALSAVAKIPVAKNLQSKPEIIEVAKNDIDESDDIIDGAQLPIGELAKTSDIKIEDDMSEDIEAIDVENDITKDDIKKSSKTGISVPDFSKFRKKLFITIILAPFVISFFVWAIWFAPAAKIIVTAKTSTAPVSIALNLSSTLATDTLKGVIRTIPKQLEKDLSVDFVATGKKLIGDKAVGIITLSNANSSNPINVPMGSVFSDGDYDFVTLTDYSVPGATVDYGIVPGKKDVNVIASKVGAEYNLSARNYDSSINGLTAVGGQMSGGNSHEAIVVTEEDIQKATQILNDLSTDNIKKQLTAQFTSGETVIADSFAVDRKAPVSLPLVDTEAVDGKAKLTSATTFTLLGISKSDIETYLKDSINKQITNANTQRIYDDGVDNVKLSGYYKNDTSNTVNLTAVGQIGPNIEKDFVKEQVKGMRFGDIQSLLGQIKGVDSVDVKFSYFWVNTVPDDDKKIEVEFVLQNE